MGDPVIGNGIILQFVPTQDLQHTQLEKATYDENSVATSLLISFLLHSVSPNFGSFEGGGFPLSFAEFLDPDDGIHGDEIWMTNGTVAGTFLLKDINPGSASSNPTEFNILNNELYFVADDGTHGQQLWKSDGTTDGTVMVTDVNEGNFHPVDMTAGGNKLYFFGNDGSHGQELWASDGTTAAMVADLNPGAGSTFPTNFAASNGKFFFDAFAPGMGDELFVSDGVTATVVKDIHPGSNGSNPREMTDVNGTLYFTANDGTNGDQIWKTDGTAANTVMVTAAGHFADNFFPLYNFNGHLVFDAPLAADGVHGKTQLYISDGTDAGTTALTTVNSFSFQPQAFFTIGGQLFFTANDGTHGLELWVSDGTPGGTHIVADINPSGSSSPSNFAEFNGNLLFNAFDGTSHSVWATDGTNTGKLFDTPGTTPIIAFASNNGNVMTSYNWIAGPGNFSDAANWDPNTGPPTTGDDASVTNGGAVTVDTDSNAQNLTIDNGSVDDNAKALTVEYALDVGGDDAQPSSLTAENAAEIDADTLTVNNGTVDINDSTLNVTDAVTVSNSGTTSNSTLTIENGGATSHAGTLDVSLGSVVVDSSTLQVAGAITVSDTNGNAPAQTSLTVKNGGEVDASAVTVDNGKVDANGGLLQVNNTLVVGGAPTNLVANGDFSGGDTGFSSDYVSYTNNLPMPGPVTPGPYAITDAANISGTTVFGDWTHITADPFGGDGNVLVADGDASGTNRVWYQTVDVTPDTDYLVSFYGVDVNDGRFNDATLEVLADNVPIGTLYTDGTWRLADFVWNSGADTSVELSLVDTNTDTDANDFAIDQISLSAVLPDPNSFVTIENGGEVDTSNVIIGQDLGSNGSVTADGQFGGASVTATQAIEVGAAGKGYLYLYNNASAMAGTFLAVGLNSGGSGLLSVHTGSTVIVDGGAEAGVNVGSSGDIELFDGSTLTTGEFMSIGQDGNGALHINSASTVNVGPLGPVGPGDGMDLGIGVGDNLGGLGAVAVDGGGSQLNVSRQIYVGGPTSNGGNTLAITNGGVVAADLSGDAQATNIDAIAVAFESGAAQFLGPDMVTVDGLGSQLNANGTIVVGVNGSGIIDVTNGAALSGHEYPTGVSGLGQFAGSYGAINVDAATYTDDDLVVADAGTGYLYIAESGAVTLGNNLVIGNQLFSNGTVQVGDLGLSQAFDSIDNSSLTVGSINVGGSFGGPGGTGLLTVQGDAHVSITNFLDIWGSANGIGTVDLYNLTDYTFQGLGDGTVAVGAFPEGEDASFFPGALVLNPGGEIDLENGVIRGGILDFNNFFGDVGIFNVTPVDQQIDDQHSVLRDVTIEGQDLTVTGAVLTLADSTNGNVTGEGGPDHVLINATSSLIDLRNTVDNFYNLGAMDAAQQPQYILMTDVALTVDGVVPIVFDPPSDLLDPVIAFNIEALSKIEGTGAIFSDYDPAVNPGAPGHFSSDVALTNHGLIEAKLNDGDINVINPGELSILTNTITNAPDGIFRADLGATLNIGNGGTPLDDFHVFTNLHDPAVVGSTLVDGAYVADGGNIKIVGNDPNSESPLLPITTLSAIVYIDGEPTVDGEGNPTTVNGDILVNGTSIEQSLTTITPSADAGEGDLILINSDTDWQNTIEIQGLTSAEDAVQPWFLEDGTFGNGGGLYLDNAVFNGPGLVVDAPDPGDPGSQAGFIYGNGRIDAPVTMNGIVISAPTVNGNALEFNGPVSGSGIYFINSDSDLFEGSTLIFDQGLAAVGGGNSVIFNGGANGDSLWIRGTDVTDTFQATIDAFDSFAQNDDIDLLDIHGTSASFDDASNVLSVFDAKNNLVATLQLDDTIPDGQTFSVSPFGGADGGTTIREGDPNFAPVISGGSSTGAVTEDQFGPPVESTSVSFSFSDAADHLYALKIEADPPLGSLAVTDGPLVLNQFITNVGASGGTLGLTYTVSDSALDFLQGGEIRTETFNIELSDGQQTFVQPYTVTVTGANDAPVVGNIDLPTSALTSFSTVGSASVATGAVHPDDFIGDNIYNLTVPSAANAGSPIEAIGDAGAIWQQVNLSSDFTVHARLFFGTGVFNQFNSGGGDGITFTLQDEGANVVGNSGSYLGVGDGADPLTIHDAVGVKFDTFDNSGFGPQFPEQPFNFSQFFANGDNETPLAENPDQLSTGYLDNGSWHDLVVSWDAVTQQLTYTLDGSVSGTLTRDLVNTDFGGDSNVYLGFTGATGSAYSHEQVEVVSVTNGTQLQLDSGAYSIPIDDQAGLTSAQVAAFGDVTSPGGTINFSDPDQLDTHTVTVTPGTVTSAPAYYSGGVLGDIVQTGFTDTVNGLNGSVTGHFSVADSDIAFLNAGDQIVETFNVNIDDGHGGVTSQPITVTITGEENQPTAVDDGVYSVLHDHALTVAAANGVLTNDLEPDQHGLSASVAAGGNPQHGSLTLNPNGSFTYMPDAHYYGLDSFTYVATDETLTSTATVSLDVTDQAPIVHDETYSVLHGQSISETGGTAGTGALAGDSDPDGDTLTASLVTGPSHGGFYFGVFGSDGSFTYIADNGYVGDDTFTYNVTDGAITTLATATIHITDTAPVVNDQVYTIQHGQQINATDGTAGTGVLHGDSDPDGDSLTAALASGGSPQHGTLEFGVVNGGGSFIYDANNNYVGDDSFTYTVTDGAITKTGTALVHIVDQAPDAVDDFYTTDENTQLSTTDGAAGTGVLHNDSDPDSVDSLTVTLLTGPTHGTLFLNTLNPGGSFSYNPNSNFVGDDSFTYTLTDGALTDTATVHITVGATTDQAPVANPDAYSVDEDNALAVPAATGVLFNDTDADHDPLTAVLVGGPAHASSFSLNSDGSFNYTPDANYTGGDSFTYKANDGTLDGNTTTVSLTINPVDDAPVITAPGPQTVAEDTNLLINGISISDVDANGAAEQVNLSVAHGSLTLAQTTGLTFITGDGSADAAMSFTGTLADIDAALASVSYLGNVNYNGADALAIHVNDQGNTGAGGPLTADASVAINVTAVDDAPVANSDSYSVVLGQTLHVAAPGVLANDSDVDGPSLSASLVSGSNDGLLTFHDDGSFDFKPFFPGSTSFDYQASDGTLSSNTVTDHIGVTENADTFDFSTSSTNMTVRLSDNVGSVSVTGNTHTSQTIGVTHNVVGGSGSDTITGNNLGDILNGGGGVDKITGGAGNDIIIGGAGNDTLTGGLGNDTFVFRSGFGQDTIQSATGTNDFTVGTAANHDTLDLRGLGFTSVDDVLAHTSGTTNAVIHAPVGTDQITIVGVTENDLSLHKFDIVV